MKTAIKPIQPVFERDKHSAINQRRRSSLRRARERQKTVESYKKWLTEREPERSFLGKEVSRLWRVERCSVVITFFCNSCIVQRDAICQQTTFSCLQTFFCRCEVICERTQNSRLQLRGLLCAIPLHNFFICLLTTTKKNLSKSFLMQWQQKQLKCWRKEFVLTMKLCQRRIRRFSCIASDS